MILISAVNNSLGTLWFTVNKQRKKSFFFLTKLASDAAYAEQYLDEWEVSLKGYVGTKNSQTSLWYKFWYSSRVQKYETPRLVQRISISSQTKHKVRGWNIIVARCSFARKQQTNLTPLGKKQMKRDQRCVKLLYNKCKKNKREKLRKCKVIIHVKQSD